MQKPYPIPVAVPDPPKVTYRIIRNIPHKSDPIPVPVPDPQKIIYRIIKDTQQKTDPIPVPAPGPRMVEDPRKMTYRFTGSRKV